ncbi:acyl-CoA thioesterase [Lutimonas zeaxanthinifaciens]|uniref:acyl-CoA thioesterase n=1 Tax=Lutimonas zeaxanthinifaciens TaxID=3060215 RepID=UPI00265D1CC3|nr:thioesterase family protein [Lutimonas sp. YSD2104]WKK65035.1 thioesterase family protein [Lutimonas sp. YSD2104]
MIKNQTKLRVRYGETDQMGYVYYGNYAQFFEVGRVEWLRALGVSYKSLEESGIMLPVRELNINYLKPAKYDDLLTITTILSKKPLVKIEFDFEVQNEQNELLTTGYASLVFMDMKKSKPIRAPKELLDQIYSYFK